MGEKLPPSIFDLGNLKALMTLLLLSILVHNCLHHGVTPQHCECHPSSHPDKNCSIVELPSTQHLLCWSCSPHLLVSTCCLTHNGVQVRISVSSVVGPIVGFCGLRWQDSRFQPQQGGWNGRDAAGCHGRDIGWLGRWEK